MLCILREYQNVFTEEIIKCESFFINHVGNALLDQSVRRMINKYTELASVELHITPHMFRHTFATSLLEADVDIRYIQEMLGHSSISMTFRCTFTKVSESIPHSFNSLFVICSTPMVLLSMAMPT